MSTSRYARSLDLDDLNAHTYGVLLTPPGSLVLDVGTADGHPVVSTLVERGCRVWGIEIDEAAAAAAAPLCEDLAVGSVEELNLQERWPDLQVDTVLCLDVLEHLVDPAATLRRLVPLLRPGGRIVISLPNVTHLAVRLQLLEGRFTYTDTGLLDGTHLRFFDRANAHALLAEAGCQVIEELAVLREAHETEIELDLDAVDPDVLERVRADPDARVYQWIFVAQPGPPAVPDAPRTGLATALFQRSLRLESADRQSADLVAELRTHLADKNVAEAETALALTTLNERLADLDAVLRTRSRELDDVTTALGAAQAALAVKDAYIAEIDRDVVMPGPPQLRALEARQAAREVLERHPRLARLVRSTLHRLPALVRARLSV